MARRGQAQSSCTLTSIFLRAWAERILLPYTALKRALPNQDETVDAPGIWPSPAKNAESRAACSVLGA